MILLLDSFITHPTPPVGTEVDLYFDVVANGFEQVPGLVPTRWSSISSGRGVADKSIPASTDGAIQAEYYGLLNENSAIGLDESSAIHDLFDAEAQFQMLIEATTHKFIRSRLDYVEYGDINDVPGIGLVAQAGDKFRLFRNGTTGIITCQVNRTGFTWVTVFTFGADTTGTESSLLQLFLNGAANSTPDIRHLRNPKGLNIDVFAGDVGVTFNGELVSFNGQQIIL